MSEAMENIQTSSPDELSGGQTPEQALAADQKSRYGFSGRQDQMRDAIGRGVQSDFSNGQAAPHSPNDANGAGTRPSGNVSGMSLSGVNVVVKPVDRRTIEGSTPGDHRAASKDTAAASLREIANNGRGPRDQMPEAPLQRGLDAPPVQSFPGNLSDSDAGN